MNTVVAEVKVAVFSDYVQLTKPRITFLVVITTLIGFLMATRGAPDVFLLLNTLIGTGLVAAGASTLNMVLEWEADARMRRTEMRPIPAGRLGVFQSLGFGSSISLIGVMQLVLFVNLLTGLLATLTLALYLFAYTPLKRRTSLCTVIGAVPGAIPPMMGWTAVTASIGFQAWWLFAILFLWQLPHFLSIAWLYREDYARGGFPMLPVLDPEGVQTSRQIILETITLIMVSVMPSFLGMTGQSYLIGALLFGGVFLLMGVRLAATKSMASARRLLLTSVIYLPLLLILMVLDRTS